MAFNLLLNKPLALWPIAHSSNVAEHGWHYSRDATRSLAQVLGAVPAPSPADLRVGCSARRQPSVQSCCTQSMCAQRCAGMHMTPCHSSCTVTQHGQTCTVSPRLPEILRPPETLPASVRILATRRACRFGRAQETVVGMHGIATVPADSG